MKELRYQEALDAFSNPEHEFTVDRIGEGLIHHTFKITSKLNGSSFLLQEINVHVFTRPAILQSNYEKLLAYLQSGDQRFLLPRPKLFATDIPLFYDSQGRCWRIFEFIERSQTFTVAENEAQAKAVAKTFSGFTASFINFDVDQLQATIPGFHDLSFRFKQFLEAIHSRQLERLVRAANLIDELRAREKYSNFYDVMLESTEFPKRVMHHDAKISNVLFDEETGQVICPVDFDTTMPGYFFSDLGDMIRSMAGTHDENSTEFDLLSIRKEFYLAIVDGYLSNLGNHLTIAEKKYIHYAGILIIYMQALRFLTDYLNGDIYYQVNYDQQNFDRAKNQITLLKRLEEYLKDEFGFAAL